MNIKKMQKAVFTARGHVDATWHSGPRGSATRAHAVFIYIIFLLLLYIYIKFFSLAYMGRDFRSYKPSGVINPTIS